MNKTHFVLAGALIDGCSNEVHRKVFVEIKNGRISAIGKRDDLPPCSEELVVDLSHCVIVPAFIDSSVQLSRSPSLRGEERPQEGDEAAILKRHIVDSYGHGVLAVVQNEEIFSLLNKSGLCAHPASLLDAPAVIQNIEKIKYTGDIARDGEPDSLMSLSQLEEVLRDGKAGKKVVVVNGKDNVADVLELGCDGIEQGFFMGEENLQKMAETNTVWIPSLLRCQTGSVRSGSGDDVFCRFSLGTGISGQGSSSEGDFLHKVFEEQCKQLLLARELGVKVVLGTGAGEYGILHGEAVIEEIKLFVKAGYTLPEAFICVSQNSAEFCATSEFGALKVGSPATFLVTRGSVKQLPRKLSYLESIYINGVPSAKYRKNPVKGK